MVSDLRKRAWRCCVLALFLVSANASATVMLSIDVDPSTPGVQSDRDDVQVGQNISVDVVITIVDEPGLAVGGFDLTVSFNSDVLEATGVTSGKYLGEVTGTLSDALSSFPIPPPPYEVVRQLGTASVQYGESYLGTPPPPTTDLLFSIAFDVVGQGSSEITVTSGSPTFVQTIGSPDPVFNVIVTREGAEITASTATVPAPSIGLLLLSGLFLLHRATKRQRSRA